MTLRKRVILIVAGVITFTILAPIALLFARGYRVDLNAGRIVQTGTLVVKTDPRDASVSLNEQSQKDTTPLTQRFLLPQEYSLQINKAGYRPWSARITIYPRRVTTVPEGDQPRIALLLNEPTIKVISTSTEELLPPPGSDEYYIQADTLYQKQGGGPPRLIAAGLPTASKTQVIVSPNKQIFLLLDDDLYQVSESLETVNTGITHASWSKEGESLVYGNDHEIWLYQPLASRPNQLITRSSQVLKHPIYHNKIGYVFFVESEQIKAVEAAPLGSPNIYTLATASGELAYLSIDQAGKKLTYLEGGSWYSLQIR